MGLRRSGVVAEDRVVLFGRRTAGCSSGPLLKARDPLMGNGNRRPFAGDRRFQGVPFGD
jgi:hypothetical protein